MSRKETIENLRAMGRRDPVPDPDGTRRKAARAIWVSETTAALRDAQWRMDQICTEAVSRLPEEEFDRLFDAEQAKVDSFLGPLKTAADKDLWPKHLYWGLL